jgi:hypothetical protein
MRIWRVTEQYSRQTLSVTRRGFECRYERPRVGGGWYTSQLLVVPWRAEKVSDD